MACSCLAVYGGRGLTNTKASLHPCSSCLMCCDSFLDTSLWKERACSTPKQIAFCLGGKTWSSYCCVACSLCTVDIFQHSSSVHFCWHAVHVWAWWMSNSFPSHLSVCITCLRCARILFVHWTIKQTDKEGGTHTGFPGRRTSPVCIL